MLNLNEAYKIGNVIYDSAVDIVYDLDGKLIEKDQAILAHYLRTLLSYFDTDAQEAWVHGEQFCIESKTANKKSTGNTNENSTRENDCKSALKESVVSDMSIVEDAIGQDNILAFTEKSASLGKQVSDHPSEIVDDFWGFALSQKPQLVENFIPSAHRDLQTAEPASKPTKDISSTGFLAGIRNLISSPIKLVMAATIGFASLTASVYTGIQISKHDMIEIADIDGDELDFMILGDDRYIVTNSILGSRYGENLLLVDDGEVSEIKYKHQGQWQILDKINNKVLLGFKSTQENLCQFLELNFTANRTYQLQELAKCNKTYMHLTASYKNEHTIFFNRLVNNKHTLFRKSLLDNNEEMLKIADMDPFFVQADREQDRLFLMGLGIGNNTKITSFDLRLGENSILKHVEGITFKLAYSHFDNSITFLEKNRNIIEFNLSTKHTVKYELPYDVSNFVSYDSKKQQVLGLRETQINYGVEEIRVSHKTRGGVFSEVTDFKNNLMYPRICKNLSLAKMENSRGSSIVNVSTDELFLNENKQEFKGYFEVNPKCDKLAFAAGNRLLVQNVHGALFGLDIDKSIGIRDFLWINDTEILFSSAKGELHRVNVVSGQVEDLELGVSVRGFTKVSSNRIIAGSHDDRFLLDITLGGKIDFIPTNCVPYLNSDIDYSEHLGLAASVCLDDRGIASFQIFDVSSRKIKTQNISNAYYPFYGIAIKDDSSLLLARKQKRQRNVKLIQLQR